MDWLVQGKWPHLADLKLGNNNLDARAIRCLAAYAHKWPCLQSLTLAHNPFREGGFRELTHGSWPKLQSLEVSACMLTRRSAGLLGLDAIIIVLPGVHIYRPRFRACWPQLHSIQKVK